MNVDISKNLNNKYHKNKLLKIRILLHIGLIHSQNQSLSFHPDF